MLIPEYWSVIQILDAVKGKLICGDINLQFSGISIDSRTISEKEIYVAIQGNIHDGHNFADDVIKKGVRGLIICKDKIDFLPYTTWEKMGIVCIGVDNTTHALGCLANFRRRQNKALIIAITGSNGKTTTCQMTAAIFARKFTTLSTQGNFNNEIGLPLTLLNLSSSHEWAVLELGMNHPGEIKRLTKICQPDAGLITNIGPAHLEGLGSIEGVLKAKGELLEQMSTHGTALLNADEPRLLTLSAQIKQKVIFFGLSKKAHIRACQVKQKGMGTMFCLDLSGEKIPVYLEIPGQFMLSNALAAASAAYLAGLSAHDIVEGLHNFKPVNGRMNVFKTDNGVNIIDDTYNANPCSMKAAITMLKKVKNCKRKIFVMGDMLELGKHARLMHEEIGEFAAESKLTTICITGKYAHDVAKGAGKIRQKNIFIGTKGEIIEFLKNYLEPDDWILVKGSRSMGMEKISNELKQWANNHF